MATVRLHKYLADCGVASRRKAEELILAKKVRVNGRIVCELGTKIDPETDKILVKERPVMRPQKGVILLHKPRGVVSTLSDPEGRPSIGDYVTKHFSSYYPVGRLDFESTGLMVLTNDGDLAERLLHPRFGLERTYHVKVSGRVTPGLIRQIDHGVRLEDGIVKAKVRLLEEGDGSSWVEVIVDMGKNRVVRRLFDTLRHTVLKLRRVRHGPFELGKLKPGEMRRLSEREYLRYRTRILQGGIVPISSGPATGDAVSEIAADQRSAGIPLEGKSRRAVMVGRKMARQSQRSLRTGASTGSRAGQKRRRIRTRTRQG